MYLILQTTNYELIIFSYDQLTATYTERNRFGNTKIGKNKTKTILKDDKLEEAK